MRNRHSLFSAALFVGSCFMLAEDTGGGDGGGDPAPDDSGGAHEDPPELLPCPFCGTADPDDSGEQISCTHCSALGPVAGSGSDKYGAWNQRDGGKEEAADPAPEDAPIADPAAVAATFKGIGAAKSAFVAEASKAKRLHAGFAKASAAAKKAKADADALSDLRVAAVKDKIAADAALATEKKTFADYKAGENGRLARSLAANGHPPVTGQTTANPGGTGAGATMTRAAFTALEPAKQSAFIRSGGRLTD